MNMLGVLDDFIEKKLLGLHTAYIGKVLATDGETAKIQPLCLWKEYGKEAQRTAVISSVPILESARYHVRRKELRYVSNVVDHAASFQSENVAVLEPIAAGDIVFCVCADRNISEAKRGREALPPVGHHNLSDSVVVGVIG